MAFSSESIDDKVIQRASAGERTAQREIYEHYLLRTFRLVRRIVGEPDAEDVTQDSFIKIFAKLNTFRFESQFTTWLHRLVVNEALQHVRIRSRSEARTFGDAIVKLAKVGDLEVQLFESPDKGIVASWLSHDRRLTVLGLKNEEEASSLVVSMN